MCHMQLPGVMFSRITCVSHLPIVERNRREHLKGEERTFVCVAVARGTSIVSCSLFLTVKQAMASMKRDVLVSPDVASRSLWSFHTSLVGCDLVEWETVDVTGSEGDFVNCWTVGKQCMGLGWSSIILQWTNIWGDTRKIDRVGISPGNGGTRGILYQVVTIRSEWSPNILDSISMVSGNKTVSHCATREEFSRFI
jgi:hypothetical protein